MCARYYQSLLCTLCMHLVRSILFTHFPCMLSAFNPLCTCLVLLIFFACSLCMPSVFNSFYKCLVLCLLCMCGPLFPISQHPYFRSSPHMLGPLFCLLAFDPLSHLYAPNHDFLLSKHLVLSLFRSFHVWSSSSPSHFNLVLSIWSSLCLVLPFFFQCLVLFPWLASSHVFL
jgi:hypothetical protein